MSVTRWTSRPSRPFWMKDVISTDTAAAKQLRPERVPRCHAALQTLASSANRRRRGSTGHRRNRREYRRAMPHTPRILEPDSAWTAADVADESVWTELLDDAEQAELGAAVRHAIETKGDDVLQIERDDFPLPNLRHRLHEIERELIDGRGFVRLRGVDRS